MDGPVVFPHKRFFEVLLAGARESFLQLQARYHHEQVYHYTLVLSAGFDCIEPGINSEEALQREVDRMVRALSGRGIEVAPGDVAKALRYQVPGPHYRVTANSSASLAEATDLLAAFGVRYADALEHGARIVPDSDGDLAAETRLDDQLTEVLEIPREVLRTLDREGLFGTGAAREQVVLDLAWFEGGRPDAWAYATGITAAAHSLLNPPAVQARYDQELAEGAILFHRLFTFRTLRK